ncbi:hypothetical protein T492DRAFT_870909, partial [Pavlovales sp. CCMP2436]
MLKNLCARFHLGSRLVDSRAQLSHLQAEEGFNVCVRVCGLMRKELGVIVARGHARLILARARSLHTQTARAAA